MTMGFLAEIVQATRVSIASSEYFPAPRQSLEHRAPPSFKGAIEREAATGALVVEFKRVSPGSDEPDLPSRSAAEFVRVTRPGGVAAYSCVATQPRFRGSPQDVADLAAETPLPILFKDFVVDPRQLDAAARSGASAVLLIARLESAGLLSSSLAELADGAHERGLEVLLELHDKSELRQIANVAADMYGVNVRDLDTLRMEPAKADATIRAAAHLRPLLGLSGVTGPGEALRFWNGGVDGILVGSAVARADDPARFLRSLVRPTPRVAP